MKVVRQGDSDTFTYVFWPHQDVQLVLLSSYGFRLAAGASEVDAVYGLADRQKKIVNTKTDVNTKRKKHLKKTRQYFSNADSLLLVHNPPSCSFKRF